MSNQKKVMGRTRICTDRLTGRRTTDRETDRQSGSYIPLEFCSRGYNYIDVKRQINSHYNYLCISFLLLKLNFVILCRISYPRNTKLRRNWVLDIKKKSTDVWLNDVTKYLVRMNKLSHRITFTATDGTPSPLPLPPPLHS